MWVPESVSPYATCEHSWIRPPSRSRRRMRVLSLAMGGSGLVSWSGGRCPRDRCGKEQHEPAPQEDRVDVEEVGGHDGRGLGFVEDGPGLVGALRCGVDPGLLQDLPDGRGADFASQAEEFAVEPSISPPRVLAREAQDQLPQVLPASVGGPDSGVDRSTSGRPGVRAIAGPTVA
ncbi:hypothetical protein SMALA_6231 [Streptomyces malaysiensis subsp. malaysiensis]|nr:hypothetical protein SMALA_6231 [Streptomyces malaysiensis]